MKCIDYSALGQFTGVHISHIGVIHWLQGKGLNLFVCKVSEVLRRSIGKKWRPNLGSYMTYQSCAQCRFLEIGGTHWRMFGESSFSFILIILMSVGSFFQLFVLFRGNDAE